ncbi:MAG: hypothetical protein RL205_1409 [Actinomycetota bacterium]|jgi:hypothetical protein
MAPALSAVDTVLDESEWRERRARHEDRVRPWVEPRQERRKSGDRHPTDDFLFEYYPYSVGKLLAWHPGHGTALGGDAAEFLAFPQYERLSEGVATSLSWLTLSADRVKRLELAIRLLEGMSSRPANTGCFGLHEWAMVYGLEQGEIRHSDFPLRLAPEEIVGTVHEVGLRCTHIDAYRFFTPEAMPLNPIEPTRATQPDLDQPGCLHANMDLYKYAMWFSPYVGSELVADCFELARTARTLDMQASPYDVSHFGLEPVRVETPEGRLEYATRQRELMTQAQPLRARVLGHLSGLRQAFTTH